MANAGADTNGSQFFIVQLATVPENIKGSLSEYAETAAEAYLEVGGTPWLDGAHTVFGQVIQGMDIVDEIATVKADANGMPEEEIIIKTIHVMN